jgi:hypothetical protein
MWWSSALARRAADFAVPLGGVTVAQAEHGAVVGSVRMLYTALATRMFRG